MLPIELNSISNMGRQKIKSCLNELKFCEDSWFKILWQILFFDTNRDVLLLATIWYPVRWYCKKVLTSMPIPLRLPSIRNQVRKSANLNPCQSFVLVTIVWVQIKMNRTTEHKWGQSVPTLLNQLTLAKAKTQWRALYLANKTCPQFLVWLGV